MVLFFKIIKAHPNCVSSLEKFHRASKLPNGFRQLFHGWIKTFAPDLQKTGFEEQTMGFQRQKLGDSTKKLEGTIQEK